jgi:hypothetical protein
MAFGRQQGGSYYLDRSPLQPASARPPRLRALKNVSLPRLFLQFTVALVGLLVVGSSLQLTVLAEVIRSASAVEQPQVGNTGEDDGTAAGNETMKKAMEDAGFDPESEEDMEKWSKQTRKPQNPNSFDALFYRLFIPQYINSTPQGVSTTNSGRTAGCNAPETGKGTVVYHNCDVPNISAEIVQDIVRFVVPSGAYGAQQESAKSIAPSFGLPSGVLPGNGQVPVNENARSNKYTALELFGYNLNYTAYLGEWDYIKVFTEARAMSNFGVFDNLKLGGSAIIDGAVNAVNGGVTGWTNGWDSSGLAGAIGGFFSGAFEGGTTGAINTILDTSDLNVFEQKAWYRPDFSATTYGARSMNSAELSAESLNWMNSMMNYFQPNKGVIPADFPSKTPPAKPLEAISSCDVISSADGATRPWGQRTTPPGVSEADCRAEGDRLKASLQTALDAETATYNDGLEDGEPERPRQVIQAASNSFDAEGVQAQESIAAWSSKNSGFISSMSKYGWSCGLPAEGSASSRAGGIDAWYSCFSSNYDANYEKALNAEKIKENNKYTDSIYGKFASVFAGWFAAQNQDKNFNAAYNRFVCVDPITGQDIMDATGNARVYKSDGSLTGNCAAIRAPIQDGLFGNGYKAGQSEPTQDTRRAAFTPVDSLGTALGNTAASMSLQVSIFATQLSNTVLGLAFTPVLDGLGIRDVLVSLIESFRDSMFMPLATLMAALGAASILWRAIKSNAYAEAFTSFLYIVAAFLLGVIILAKPLATMKAVDEGPVFIENSILSVMFTGNGADDELCTATGTASGSGKGGTQIDGSKGYDPNMGTRILMCENWRSFAFTPWVFGQWGTGYENLYANGYAPAGGQDLNNTNQKLVGNAGVNFGGGQVVHNWAAYQLAVTSVGTSTTADPSRPTGVVNKNFYRIVDAQMGPNGGAGTDPTYAQSWSKFNGDTAAAMILGPVASVMGAVVVIGYTIAKIELVLVSMFLLVILPIMLLIGIHPTFGRQKLKTYAGTLVGLMIQRILLTVLLGLLFKFMFSISASGASYLVIAIVSIVVAAIFIGYRREILGLVQKSMDQAAGSFAGGRLYDTRRAIAERIPVSVRNFAAMQKQEARGLAFGTIAALRHGQMPSEIPGTLDTIRKSYKQREAASQMLTGLGGGQKAQRVRSEIDGNLDSKFNRSKDFEGARNALLERSGVEGGSFDKAGNLVTPVYQTENPDDRAVDDQGRVLDDKGKPIVIGEKVERTSIGTKKTIGGAAVRRSMVKHNELTEKLQMLEERKTTRIVKGERRALERMGYGNIDELQGEDRVRAQAARAQIHIELTRHSRLDGRSLAADGSPLAIDRRGTGIEGDIAATSKALDGTIYSGVASGRFAPNAERREAQKAAYSELKGLVNQAAQDLDEATGVTRGIRSAADSVDRVLGVSDIARDTREAVNRRLGRDDFGDFDRR